MEYKKKIRKAIINLSDEVITLRRDFHMYPEGGFQEVRTSGIVESYLKDLGIETKRLARTGIIGTLKGKEKGPVIALRADMDALPVIEENECAYRSKNSGMMHACGHDGHTAILLATAKYLSLNRERLKGTVRFIFQPSEEGDGGAVPMIKEGCLENPKVQAIFALHLWSRIEVGEIDVVPGPMMASTQEIAIEIKGKGGHAAAPHEAVDSIVVASHFVSQVQTIISRYVDPFENAIITFGTIEGGTNFNVIAPSVSLTGTVRHLREDALKNILHRVENVLKTVCQSLGANYTFEKRSGYITLINHPQLTQFLNDLASDFIGADNIYHLPSMGGEDFAYYAKEVPGCFFFLGAGNKDKGIDYPQHHPRYNIDEEALLVGIEFFARIIESTHMMDMFK